MQQPALPLSPALQRSLPARGALAVGVAVLANVAVVVAADAVGLAPGFDPLSPPSVVFLSAVGAVGATVVYAGLRRYVDRPDRTFVRVAAVVLLASFLPDIGLLSADPAATVPGVVLLMFMHVVVAAVSVGLLVGGGESGHEEEAGEQRATA
jgi:hypothetical protein